MITTNDKKTESQVKIEYKEVEPIHLIEKIMKMSEFRIDPKSIVQNLKRKDKNTTNALTKILNKLEEFYKSGENNFVRTLRHRSGYGSSGMNRVQYNSSISKPNNFWEPDFFDGKVRNLYFEMTHRFGLNTKTKVPAVKNVPSVFDFFDFDDYQYSHQPDFQHFKEAMLMTKIHEFLIITEIQDSEKTKENKNTIFIRKIPIALFSEPEFGEKVEQPKKQKNRIKFDCTKVVPQMFYNSIAEIVTSKITLHVHNGEIANFGDKLLTQIILNGVDLDKEEIIAFIPFEHLQDYVVMQTSFKKICSNIVEETWENQMGSGNGKQIPLIRKANQLNFGLADLFKIIVDEEGKRKLDYDKKRIKYLIDLSYEYSDLIDTAHPVIQELENLVGDTERPDFTYSYDESYNETLQEMGEFFFDLMVKKKLLKGYDEIQEFLLEKFPEKMV